MSAAISFLAGMGAGYLSAKDKVLEQERQKKRDDREQTTFDNQQTVFNQAQAEKAALKDAATPASVQPEQQATGVSADSMDMDQPAAAADASAPATRYKVGANTFADKGVAEKTADDYNAPSAVRKRLSTLAAQGNAGASTALQANIASTEGEMKITKAQREEANSVFDQGLRTALQSGGPQGLAQFMSDSKADGQDGAMKFQAQVSPDGKSWQMTQVGTDGTAKPFGKVFANDEAGMAEAGLMLSRSVSDESKVKHTMDVAEAARRAKHDEGMLAVSQQNANSTTQNANTAEQYRKDQAANMREQRRLQEEHNKAIASGKAQANAPIQVTLKDMNDFEGNVDKYIKDQFPVKDGADDKERALLNAQATTFKATASSIFQTNAAHGIPLTAGTVMQAMELAKDPTNQRVYADPTTGQKYMGVVVNGTPVAVSGALQQPQAQPAQAGAPANSPTAAPAQAPNPAAMAAQGVQPTPAPAAPRPMNSVEQIQAQGVATLQPLADQLKQANAQFVAAAQSGDQRSIAQYMQAKETLRLQLEKQVNDKFGNAAPRVLQQLMAQ